MLRNFTQAFSWICSESRKPLFIYTSLPSPCSRAHGHAQSSFIVMVAFKRWKIDRSVNWVGNCIDLFYSSRGMSGKKFAIHVDIITKIYNIVRWSIFRFLEYRKKYFKILKKKIWKRQRNIFVLIIKFSRSNSSKFISLYIIHEQFNFNRIREKGEKRRKECN